MSNSTLRISIGPLLQTRFSMAGLLTTHAAGSTIAFVCRALCADNPFAASASDLSTRCGNVVYKRSSWHLSVIVSAYRVSQLSVNDGGRVRALPCKWRQIVASRLVLAPSARRAAQSHHPATARGQPQTRPSAAAAAAHTHADTRTHRQTHTRTHTRTHTGSACSRVVGTSVRHA